MDDKPQRDGLRIGYLATVVLPANTFFGGLLITDRKSRPLEFRCTAPVQPNGTQVLLYGPTLQPYVLTELIGKTLVDQASIRPDVVLVDDAGMLPLREHVAAPVGCLDAVAVEGPSRVGLHALKWHAEFPKDEAAVEQLRQRLPAEVDLLEPFERVRSALKEAVGAARAA
ncbi:MAG: hypothetical protein ACE5KM_01900 [Planctomycetaceae bacterium]